MTVLDSDERSEESVDLQQKLFVFFSAINRNDRVFRYLFVYLPNSSEYGLNARADIVPEVILFCKNFFKIFFRIFFV